jgi:hypothetical protein
MADAIAMNLDDLDFGELASFAQKIHNGFIDHVGDYPSPGPGMATFQGHITDLDKAIIAWGKKGNRGRTVDQRKVLKTAGIVKKDLTRLEKYAMITQSDNPKSWLAVGFPLRKERTKAGTLEAVRDFHRFISRRVSQLDVKLKWKKPLDTKRSMIKSYIVQWNDKPGYPEDPHKRILMNVIAVVTETTFTDAHPLPGANYYWVTPLNSAGLGVRSGMIRVVMPLEEPEEE